MAVTINADTSNGLVLTPDTSGEIKLQSAGADIVSVTANGMAVDTNTLYVDATNNNVGIGTSSPTTELDVSGTVQSQNNAASNDSVVGAYNFYNTNASASANPIRASIVGGRENSAWGAYLQFNTSTGTSAQAERMRIQADGRVFIGCTTDPSSSVAGWRLSNPTVVAPTISTGSGTGATTALTFQNGNGVVGQIYTSGTSTSYVTSSDYRLKENILPMSGNIERLKQLKPSTWTWVNGGNGEGFLAHEAQTVVPEAISGTKDAVDDEGNPVYQGIDQSKLVPLLTAALQEAITKIEDLETRIQALENA